MVLENAELGKIQILKLEKTEKHIDPDSTGTCHGLSCRGSSLISS